MITRDQLMEDVESLHLNEKGTLLVHSSMKAIGEVEGGGETVLDVLSAVMEEGLLVLPTHTWNRMGKDLFVYDVRTTPACVGILPNLFLQRPGVVRSLHPVHSVAALGKDAPDYIQGEELLNTPCPREGCWGKLIDRDAEILFLGCSLRSNTFIHGVEEWNNIPDRVSQWTQDLTVIGPQGERYEVQVHRHECKACEDISEHYDKLEAPFLKLGAIRYGQVGNARCIIGKAAKMNEIASQLLERDKNLFLNHEPIPVDWY